MGAFNDIYKYATTDYGRKWDKLNSKKRRSVIRNIVLDFTFPLTAVEKEALEAVMLASVEMFHPVAIVEAKEAEEREAMKQQAERLERVWSGTSKNSGLVRMWDI